MLEADCIENFIPELNFIQISRVEKRSDYMYTSFRGVNNFVPRTKLLLKVKQVKTFQNKALKKLNNDKNIQKDCFKVTVNILFCLLLSFQLQFYDFFDFTKYLYKKRIPACFTECQLFIKSSNGFYIN